MVLVYDAGPATDLALRQHRPGHHLRELMTVVSRLVVAVDVKISRPFVQHLLRPNGSGPRRSVRSAINFHAPRAVQIRLVAIAHDVRRPLERNSRRRARIQAFHDTGLERRGIGAIQLRRPSRRGGHPTSPLPPRAVADDLSIHASTVMETHGGAFIRGRPGRAA